MRVEIVVVGNELLGGDLADTNTRRLGELLRDEGLVLSRGQTVPDEIDAVADALMQAAGRADLVLVSGGLGPTEDDLTLEAAARALGVDLVLDAPTLERIRARFARRGFPFTENNARQAMLPEGAVALENPVGTAPAVRLPVGRATVFFFPGVPSELDRLARDHLVPWLAENAAVRPSLRHVFRTFGKTESQVATLLGPLPRGPGLHVAYRATFPEIRVTLHVTRPDPGAACALLEERAAGARALLGDLVYSEDAALDLPDVVVGALAARGLTLAAAESCTGGLVSTLLTSVPGASAVFREGVVTYANDSKTARLGVPAALLAEHGAVSEPVARAMAEGARLAAGADLAVAITGIAGPSGGSPEKPVGTVHLALAAAAGTTHLHRRLPFDRERNRVASAWAALDMVRRHVAGTAAPGTPDPFFEKDRSGT